MVLQPIGIKYVIKIQTKIIYTHLLNSRAKVIIFALTLGEPLTSPSHLLTFSPSHFLTFSPMSPFLTAHWQHLILLNYRIDPEVLKPWLPAQTELDLWNDTCYVSLVGFLFLDTRIKGWHIPFHVNFEEINLRFYVKRQTAAGEWRRGVVFIREIVSKPAIAWIANSIYRERYAAHPTTHRRQETGDNLEVLYAWRQNKRWHTFSVQADPKPVDLKVGSEAEFITEHYWGYSRRDEQHSIEYAVEHPRWRMHPIRGWMADVDFGAVYGPGFGDLQHQAPVSIFLAEGADVKVYPGKIF